MPYVVGIDQSLHHTGICILNQAGEVCYLGLVEPKGLQNQERLAFIRDAYATIFAERRFVTGVMEGYSYGSFNKPFLLGEVGAVTKLALYDHGDALFEAAPKALKKFITAKGSASKEEVIFAIEKQWGVVIQDNNLADAYGLAQIAKELTWPSSCKRHQLDVIRTLKNKDLKKPKRKTQKKRFVGAI
jgi:crossover junction endodeoxyribonuclease RuvC